MDRVRVASQPSGLTPSTRARPSLRAVAAQRSCVGSSCFSARIACANCAASWTVSTEWHRCWRLTCFAHTFLRDALKEKRTLTGSLACVEPAPCGLAAFSWLVDLTPGESSVLKVHLTPRFAHFTSALMVGRHFLPIHLCSLPLGSNNSVILCFFFLVFNTALTSWGRI